MYRVQGGPQRNLHSTTQQQTSRSMVRSLLCCFAMRATVTPTLLLHQHAVLLSCGAHERCMFRLGPSSCVLLSTAEPRFRDSYREHTTRRPAQLHITDCYHGEHAAKSHMYVVHDDEDHRAATVVTTTAAAAARGEAANLLPG